MKRLASLRITAPIVLVLTLLATAVGCGGATTDARDEAESGGASGTHPLPAHGSLTEECDGAKGLTGQSLLDKLDVPTSAVFRRFPPDKPYGYTDPATSSHATIRIRYDGGDVRCTPAGDTSGARMNPTIVLARVGVIVSVDFSTDDGLFDEHVSAELSSSNAESSSVQLDATLAVAELHGSYRAIAEADGLGASVPMKLTGTFTKADLAGSEGAVDHGERFVGLFRFDW